MKSAKTFVERALEARAVGHTSMILVVHRKTAPKEDLQLWRGLKGRVVGTEKDPVGGWKVCVAVSVDEVLKAAGVPS